MEGGKCLYTSLFLERVLKIILAICTPHIWQKSHAKWGVEMAGVNY